MSDIVKRLRQSTEAFHAPSKRLAHEAADEIERKRALVREIERENEDLRAEIERLRAALKPFVHLGETGHLGLVIQEDIEEGRRALEGK